MRPGQAAPVFRQDPLGTLRRFRRFNEAGAGCPGILEVDLEVIKKTGVASMRPGQAAPVFSASRWRWHS